MSKQAEAPKDNRYDLKSKEVNPVPIQDNMLIFSGTQRKGLEGSREPSCVHCARLLVNNLCCSVFATTPRMCINSWGN